MLIDEIRHEYHQSICLEIIRLRKTKDGESYPNFADSCSVSSKRIAVGIVERLGSPLGKGVVKEQAAGSKFEVATKDFLEKSFEQLHHLRPGSWKYAVKRDISHFDQYQHLAYIDAALKKDKTLCSALQGDYIVKSDVLISRLPAKDEEINSKEEIIHQGDKYAALTPLRAHNQKNEILHASVSCKWTIRSDRSQNTRTEALNLIRNRKGNLPHIVAVTAEPLPTRIAALALGTGDLDCVYHFALIELKESVIASHNQDQLDMLETMIQGNRLRDISDLPFDLAI
jgi:hypothetical protein